MLKRNKKGEKMKRIPLAFLSVILLFTSCSMPSKPKQKLNDSQIVEIMMTVDNLEIAVAKVAKKKMTTPPVAAFADYLMQQHQENLDRLIQLTRQLNIEPQESVISKKLLADRDALVASLSKLEGNQFDNAYVEAMIKSHRDGLKLIDSELLPQVQNAQLKSFVEIFRAMVKRHLERGLTLQKTL